MRFTVKDLLRLKVTPALGCTEPGAVALAVVAVDPQPLRIDAATQVLGQHHAVASEDQAGPMPAAFACSSVAVGEKNSAV